MERAWRRRIHVARIREHASRSHLRRLVRHNWQGALRPGTFGHSGRVRLLVGTIRQYE